MVQLRRAPKRKMLIGHEASYDVYQTPRGTIYHYRGTKKAHWKNPRFWEKITK
jgi:hypothetical protein